MSASSSSHRPKEADTVKDSEDRNYGNRQVMINSDGEAYKLIKEQKATGEFKFENRSRRLETACIDLYQHYMDVVEQINRLPPLDQQSNMQKAWRLAWMSQVTELRNLMGKYMRFAFSFETDGYQIPAVLSELRDLIDSEEDIQSLWKEIDNEKVPKIEGNPTVDDLLSLAEDLGERAAYRWRSRSRE